jgi:uracil-DNA glycosylase
MKQHGNDSDNKTRRMIVQRLESLHRAGVSHLPKAKHLAPANLAVPASERSDSQPPLTASKPYTQQASSIAAAKSLFDAAPFEQAVVPPHERPAALDVIRGEVVACTRCKELAAGRTQTVFGVGNPNARICFFGEAPGADEDRLGEPFVGRAGQLLDKMIVACKMNREDVYILNVLKCRPPGNRNPLPDEVTNCRGFFERQLDVIRPEVICCLGAVAAQSLLVTDRSIGKLRGQFHDYRGIPVICTYHPAYLLRNPAAKHDTWEDLKLMMRKLGVEL